MGFGAPSISSVAGPLGSLLKIPAAVKNPKASLDPPQFAGTEVHFEIDKPYNEDVKSITMSSSVGNAVDDTLVLTVHGHKEVKEHEPFNVTISRERRTFYAVTWNHTTDSEEKQTTITCGTQLYRFKNWFIKGFTIQKDKPIGAADILGRISSAVGADLIIDTDSDIKKKDISIDVKTQAIEYINSLGRVKGGRQVYFFWVDAQGFLHFKTRAETTLPEDKTLDAKKIAITNLSIVSSSVNKIDVMRKSRNPKRGKETDKQTTDRQTVVSEFGKTTPAFPGSSVDFQKQFTASADKKSVQIIRKFREHKTGFTVSIDGLWWVRPNQIVKIINASDTIYNGKFMVESHVISVDGGVAGTEVSFLRESTSSFKDLSRYLDVDPGRKEKSKKKKDATRKRLRSGFGRRGTQEVKKPEVSE